MNMHMQKSQKRQIENMLELLDKAQEATKKALATGNNEIALSLLEQCQDSAIQIGGIVEESLGEDFVTIELLESYCEQIYQTYESIRQNRLLNANKTHKNLRKELIRIENSVKNDIQVRTKVVFLPYKASMWDSLESVWKAADEDPNCDAYVVPIPYFDKNPDGSFREMHYEGNEYPKYVPITSWETFDIAAEHPDVIFIHNPYDEFNHVTSILPMYYSKELKNCTDLLVYIPYFVLREIDPANKESVEKLEHFCTVPAVVYADKVIVQSKKWRQVYIDVMTRTMGKDTRQVWENKILGLGSPKMDKVHTTGKDDLEIPEEWLKIIEKPDGSWKKIIFYNTSVAALLRHSEQMLEKMEAVFRVFKENRDEVTLLWRPHPLIKATIESMRPQLWIEYEKMVKTYIEEGWGIYDDTADMNRAVALSDAYYGDHSSIVQIYEQTGKPIMMQNVEITSSGDGNLIEKSKLNLHFESYVRVENKVYFSESFFNGLFELDLNEYSVRFVCRFSNEYEARILLHGAAILHKNKLFFFPKCSRQIHCYDLITQQESSMTIPIQESKEFVIAGAIQRENKVWLFSSDFSLSVFVFDMEAQSLDRAEEVNDLLSKYKPFAGILDAAEEGKVYFYCNLQSVLLEIDIEKAQIKEYKVAIDNSDLYLAGFYAGEFYFQDVTTGEFYKWNRNTDCITKFIVQDLERTETDGILFVDCCFTNENSYMIPWRNNFVLQNNDGVLKKAFDYPKDFQRFDMGKSGYNYVPGTMKAWEVIDDKIWFYPFGFNQLLIFDTKTGQISGRKIDIDADKVFPCEGRLRENTRNALDYFCCNVKKSEQYDMISEESCGGKMYKAIMDGEN